SFWANRFRAVSCLQRLPQPCDASRAMTKRAHVLALVSDAFGGQGGIAQYNRDFLGALAGCGCFSIRVLTRQRPGPCGLPDGIAQRFVRRGRSGFAVAALAAALLRPVDVV